MKFLRKTTWDEIFQDWKKAEEGWWEELYQERGYTNWEDFRNFYVDQIPVNDLDWKLCDVTPEEVLDFQCGMYRGWKEMSQEVGSRRFRDLVRSSRLTNNIKLNAIFKNFPDDSMLIGFKRNGNIIILEGTHRCLAVSKMINEQDARIQSLSLQLALADISACEPFAYVDF